MEEPPKSGHSFHHSNEIQKRKTYYCSKFCQIVRVKTKNLRYCTIPQIWVTIPQIFHEMAIVWNQKTEVLYDTVDFRKSTVLYNTAVFWFHNGAISRIFHNSGSTSPICKMFRFLEMALNFDGSFSFPGGRSMKIEAVTANQIFSVIMPWNIFKQK